MVHGMALPDPNKRISFDPNPDDAEVIGALQQHTGLSGTALLRLCLRGHARKIGAWSPSASTHAYPGTAEAGEPPVPGHDHPEDNQQAVG